MPHSISRYFLEYDITKTSGRWFEVESDGKFSNKAVVSISLV